MKSDTPPTLSTERLTLRPLVWDDWPAYSAFLASERARFMSGPHKVDTAWSFFCNDIAQWTLFGHGALMFEETASGTTLGQVALCKGPLFPELELGWFVFAGAEGRGFAFEAAAALRNWGFQTLGMAECVSYIDPENHRSIRLAERLGARRDPEAEAPDPTSLVYRHLPG
ncbi:GNAT family N-acetyltransferase [Martelella endophytica]|uniref:Acetyltransferase n=1 Tax=Martelella endophytica TaxID=1486262 RepID=A0A0D5LW85_MAREN|nr:GNAT family N-acetyltransferase [Martelella endophytica]AJY48220.1 acetyltransferase [Martelella endophytica]